MGLLKERDMICILDILKGFPEDSCLWIGLLLVHGKQHNQHIGRQIVQGVIKAAKESGYKKIQLGVIDNNVKGLSFWHKNGFKKINDKKMPHDTKGERLIIVMEMNLS